jgi:hypothetical protein
MISESTGLKQGISRVDKQGIVGIAFKMVGAVAIVVGSFYATLEAMDYFSPDKIRIEEATYGANCGSGVKPGNATQYVAKACDGQPVCSMLISVESLGDPAIGCAKDFALRYLCDRQQTSRRAYVKGEANGKTLRVQCQE